MGNSREDPTGAACALRAVKDHEYTVGRLQE